MAQAFAMTFILCLVIAASLPIKSGVLKSDMDGSHFSITNASNFISSVGGFYGKVGVLTNASGTSIAYTTSSVAYSQLPYEPKLTNANARRWLYQHSWIVTGARFGWWHGEQAVVKLIAVDQRVEQIWGIGHRSEQVARATLARVRRASR